MGGRGLFSIRSSSRGGSDSFNSYADDGLEKEREKARRTWDEEQEDWKKEDEEREKARSDWIDINDEFDREFSWENEEYERIFKWIGLSSDEAQSYFDKEIKPVLDFKTDIFTGKDKPDIDWYDYQIRVVDDMIIDDFQLGNLVQNYRDELQYKRDMVTGYDNFSIDTTDTNTNVHTIDHLDKPETGLTIDTSAGKEGVIISQSTLSDGRHVSIVEFSDTETNRSVKCACLTDNIKVTKL